MQFEVYCDESCPDVLTSSGHHARHLLIGSLWLPARLRNDIKQRVHALRQRYGVWGEIKWTKVSPSRQVFYQELIQLFISYGNEMRFRCIAVDHAQIDHSWHGDDNELGFYKFYYQLLHHWVLDFNDYSIYCDAKTNRDPKRLSVLQRCLSRANLSSTISNVQSLPSDEVVLIQLADLLLGAAGNRLNNRPLQSTAKAAVVEQLEAALGRELGPTPKGEEKFNVFKIRLQGGW